VAFTLSCISGAAAITKAWHHLGMIQAEQRVNLLMLGGPFECKHVGGGQVSLLGSQSGFLREIANYTEYNGGHSPVPISEACAQVLQTTSMNSSMVLLNRLIKALATLATW